MSAAQPDTRPIETCFQRRGWTPFPFQIETWRAYLAGESGLLHAPTGYGKSYAVWGGPLVEWLHEHAHAVPAMSAAPAPPRRSPSRAAERARLQRAAAPDLRVLWITPLRALANDATTSLAALVAEMNLPWTVETRTGDTAQSVKARQKEKLPTCLVTTPESLSLLLSYADTRGKFAELRCIVVDEWHELLSSKRGVQTELGLARLRTWLPALRTWGLSATLGNLDEARAVLMGGSSAGRLIHGEFPKRIEVETLLPPTLERFPWAGHIGVRLIDQVVEKIAAARSTLLFTNTRSQSEIWFQVLVQNRPDWVGEIALHHGSIDRELRGEIETRLRQGRMRCVVCTSSLDLGVDFSPVDQVLQVGSPKGIARLIQRAGRSGHTPGALSRVVCIPTHALELVEFAAARDAIAARRLERREPLQQPLDVLAQHVVTVALGGGFREEELLAEVRRTHAYRLLSDEQWRWVMDFCTRGGPALRVYPQYARIIEQDGRYVIASSMIARHHRMSIGTITSDSSMRVAYLTGGSLGHIEESFVARLHEGDVFVFAGRMLEFIRARQMTAYVRPARRARGTIPRWGGSRMPLSTQLADVIRSKLDAARQGELSGPEMQPLTPLFELQARWSRIPQADELLIERTQTHSGHHWFVFALEGRLVHEGLSALVGYRLTLARPRSITMSSNDYGFELLGADPIDLDETGWRDLLSTRNLISDLLAALNGTELARRQFREIARVAGLVFPGFPGQDKSARQLQASSALFYDVFTQFDPENMLLDQARREVLEHELEIRRLQGALERIARLRLTLLATERLSPLAFPLWAESLRPQHVSSEKWSARVQKMVVKLEADADTRPAPRRPARGRPRESSDKG